MSYAVPALRRYMPMTCRDFPSRGRSISMRNGNPHDWISIAMSVREFCFSTLLQWRRQDLEARCLAFIREHADKILMHDQDVLNVICQESLGLLDRTWDAQVCCTRQARLSGFNELGRTANIIHFIGARKPWLPGCRAPYRRNTSATSLSPPGRRPSGATARPACGIFSSTPVFPTAGKNGTSAASESFNPSVRRRKSEAYLTARHPAL